MSNPEAFVHEEDFRFLLRPNSKFPVGSQLTASGECNPDPEDREEDEVASKEHDQCQAKNTEEDAVAAPEEEEEDGYQTPTSPRHKIPTHRQYPPPAPKKPRPTLLVKRKASPDCRRILIDLPAQDLELIFGPILTHSGRKIKKARSAHAE